MVRMVWLLAASLFLGLALPYAVVAQEQFETLRFRPGSESMTVRGVVVAFVGINYRVDADDGQRMTIELNSRNRGLTFAVVDPRGRTIAREQRRWSGRLPMSGKYRIAVALSRDEARRGAVAPFDMNIRVAGGGGGGGGGGSDRTWRVVGVSFDDTLNMRERPNPRAFIVDEIPFDATGLRDLGCTEDRTWCKVRYRRSEGWVAGRFLRPDR